MKPERSKRLPYLWLLFVMACIFGTAGIVGAAAPVSQVPTGPKDINGQWATPDYYTTANWANSPPLAKFVDTLPGLTSANQNNLGQYLPIAQADTLTYPGSDYYIIELREYSEKMHSDLNPTKLRGYVQVDNAGNPISPIHYLGPIILAERDKPVRIKFVNKLPTGSGGDLFIPVDTTVMGAGKGPLTVGGQPCDNTLDGNTCASYTQNRADIHLHGGRTPWISDGTPHQWITPATEVTPFPSGVSLQHVPDMPDPGPGATNYYFSNQQSARLMFYHDHAFGITRLNVYIGEAAGYLITDQFEQDLVTRGLLPADQIPLIIQDKTFVDATPTTKYIYNPATGLFDTPITVPAVRATDPLWNWGSGTPDPVTGIRPPVTGDLWLPHVYMPAQQPTGSATGGTNPFGRWMYGPWFYPATVITHGPVANPYYDPNCSSLNPFELAQCQTPGQPPLIPGTLHPSMGMEAFQDSAVVNGTAFPTLTVDPRAYRFRILNAASDRFQNLSFYEADPAQPSPAPHFSPGHPAYRPGMSNLTEVRMLPASADLAAQFNWPPNWPTDGRDGGVPDPAFRGPTFLQIGTEGGFLPKPVVIEQQPITYITDPTAFWVGNVDKMGLALGPAERADVIVDFSAFAGKTLILYNDGPAAWPARVPGYDYYTNAPDRRDTGGFGTGGTWDPITGSWLGGTGPLVGYAPNTRTVMQVIVRPTLVGPANSYNQANLEKEFTAAAPVSAVNPPPTKTLFERAQEPIIVGQPSYSTAYPNSYFPTNFPWEGVNQINDHFLQFVTLAGEQVKVTTEPKGIHDEMGASFDPEYGRMSGNLGMQLANPTTLNANLILYGFNDIPTEFVNSSASLNVEVLPGLNGLPGTVQDGTQVWKISHNGVDTHPIHFHIFDVQLINRVGWDGLLLMPEPNELGWKDTVKISPLEDTIVAVRPRAPSIPFGVPNSIRPLNPAIPIDSAMGFNPVPTNGSAWPFFNSVDWKTGATYPTNNPTYPYPNYKGVVTNVLYNFGWEYVWHCHILSHEEMDMMRAINLNVPATLPPAFTAQAIVDPVNSSHVDVGWNDPTPVNYNNLNQIEAYRNPGNEIGFNVYRSTDGGASFNKLNATTLLANSTAYIDTTPLAGAIYQVEAFNAAGSTFSSTARTNNVTVGTVGAPFASPGPVNLTAAITNVPAGVTITQVAFYNGATLLGLAADVNAPAFTWTNVSQGSYSVTARVTDSQGVVTTSTPITVTVNGALVADFTVTGSANGPDIGFCETITFTSTTAGATGYGWSINGVNYPPTPTFSTTLAAGTYPVTLTVVGGTGATAQVTKNVTIVNHNPTAITGGPYTVLTGAGLTLNGSGTDTLDSCNATPLTFAWNIDNVGAYDFFTANPALTNNMLKTVLGAGTHPVTLQVKDSNGGIGTATTTITMAIDPPASITVPATSVTGSYTVSWPASPIPGVTFELQEAAALAGPYATVYSGTTNSFAVTGKASGTTFFYRVRSASIDATLTTAWTTGATGCTTTIIAITAPVNAGTVVQGTPTSITVTVPPAPAGSTLARVEFYAGTTLLGNSTVTPYSFAWTPAVGVATYALTAKAVYTNGAISTSPVITVGGATAIPTITLDTPANGSVYDLGSTLALSATPANIGVTINWVAFFDGATMVGIANAAPYSASYTPAAGGVHSLTASAYYSNGAIATSTATSVTINGTVSAPASITVPASSTSGTYTVSWAASSTTGVTYTLEESTTAGFTAGTTTVVTSGLTSLSTLISGKAYGTYYYRVKAVKVPMADSAWTTPSAIVVASINVALQINGGVASASSSLSASYPPASVNNGDRAGLNYGNGGAWADANTFVYPDWVQVPFSGPNTINEIDVFTVQDNFTSPVTPTLGQTFTKYGITDFNVQYWDGATWITVPSGAITNNNLVWNKITFPAVTTDRIRVLVNNSINSYGYSIITEVEAWTTNTTPAPAASISLASPANGAVYLTVPASIPLTANVVAVNGWVTNRVDYYNGATLIGSSNTAPSYSFNWTNVPVGTYTLTAKAVESLGATSTSAASTVTVGSTPINIALASNGSVATASSFLSAAYPPSSVINGDRAGSNYGSGGAWADANTFVYPDWVQVTFNGLYTINEIDVFTVQDNFTSPVTPTVGQTFTKYGITDFNVQYWDGATWVTVPGGGITNNNLVWNKITFPAVTTDRVRVLVNNSINSYGYSIITEVEAWTTTAAAAPAATVSLTAPTNGTVYPSVPASIPLTSNVVTANGWTTSRVDYYNGATLIGTSSTGPSYSFTWTNVPAGTYSLTAVAVESLGATSTSPASTVTVGALPVNVALAANGSVATASSSLSASYLPAGVIDGDRAGLNYGNGGVWVDGTPFVYPDWVQVTFNAPKTINEIDVFTVQDNFTNPVTPTAGQVSTRFAISDFNIQYWDGATWVTLPGGAITNNNLIWTKITFPAVTTTQIRVLVNNTINTYGYSAITEIEAWAP